MSRTTFIKHGIIYWLAKMASRAISFLFLPIYTALIAPKEWGTLNILIITGDMIALVALCQLTSAMFRFWALTEEEKGRRHLAGFVFLVPLFLSTVIFVPAYLWPEPFASLLGVPGCGNLLRIVLCTQQLSIMLSIIQAEMRLRDQVKRYALYDILYNIGTAVLNVFFVAVLHWGITGILIGQLLGFATVVGLLLPRFARSITPNLDKALFKKLFAFSLPLIPSAVAMGGMNNIDRYFIQYFQGPSQVGIYSLGYKFGLLVTILVTAPFFFVWEPKSYQIAKREDASAIYGQVFSYLAALLLFVFCGLAGASREILQLMASKQYYAGWQVVPIVALAYVLFSLDSVTKMGLLLFQKTKIIMFVVLTAFALNCIANAVLIPRYGMRGAAMATLISFLALFILDWLYARKYLAIEFEWKRLGMVIATAAATLILLILFSASSLFLTIVGKIVILSFYPLALIGLGFVPKKTLLDSIIKVRNKIRPVGLSTI